LPKHLDELAIVINELSFDIITINETRLDESFNDRDVRISGYDIIRRDRNIEIGTAEELPFTSEIIFLISSDKIYSFKI
jgi:hypothetical protein